MLKMQDKELNIEDLANAIVVFIKKNFIFIIAFVLVGLVLGFLRHQKAQNVHQSNVYAKSTFIPLDLIKNEISSINALLEAGDFTKLGNVLQLDNDVLSKWSSIKYFSVSENDKLCSFQITSIGENNPNEQILTAVSNYLESNPYLKNYLDLERDKLKQNDAIYKSELANLTKIQDGLLDKDVKKNYAILTNPSELSMSIIDLQKLIKNNEFMFDEVAVYKLIDVVDITTKPSLTKSLITNTIVICFLGAFFLITFRLFWRKP